MKLLTAFVLLCACVSVCSSCKKIDSVAIPPQKSNEAAVVGDWKLVNLTGQIDSAATVDGVKNITSFTMSFDSVTNQYVQKINSQIKYQYPYALTISLGANNEDEVTESYTKPNGAGLTTPYYFSTHSSWSYTNTNGVNDGLIIRGFKNTSALGDPTINASNTNGSTYIQSLLSSPVFTSYDVRNGHLYLYVHIQNIGNADSASGKGSVTNPAIQINADYVLTFGRNSDVTAFN